MRKSKEVTCRYGITYEVEGVGTEGAILRLFDMLSKCCCWVCHNRGCKEPRNEIIPDCGEVCQIYTKIPYCKK